MTGKPAATRRKRSHILYRPPARQDLNPDSISPREEERYQLLASLSCPLRAQRVVFGFGPRGLPLGYLVDAPLVPRIQVRSLQNPTLGLG